MKVHVLFDDAGRIQAMSHPIPGQKAKLGRFRAGNGQRVATVDVPPEISHLSPRQLHDAVHVEHRNGAAHLVAHTR